MAEPTTSTTTTTTNTTVTTTSVTTSPSHHGSERSTEPVRSRWTPKPEQIHILETIFNSGMVNPPRDETVRIRRLLEKFGSVTDANIFYWFQNRRSRTRRRQRQLKSCFLTTTMSSTSDQYQIINNNPIQSADVLAPVSAPIPYNLPASSSCSSSSSVGYFAASYSSSSLSSCGHGADDLFSISPHLGLPEIDQNPSVSPLLCSSDPPNLHCYQPGFITVYINGVLTEVPRGAIDMKSMFGQDAMLVHSSGVPVPVDEFGITLMSLQMGESYFLVSGPS